jgi:hypothetical protein
LRVPAFVILCFCFILIAPYYSWGLSFDYDGGVIQRIVDDRIYVKGELGNHVFEPIGVCSWCEEGVEVSIAFKGYTRATLQPKSLPFPVRPLPVLIVRDGRE